MLWLILTLFLGVFVIWPIVFIKFFLSEKPRKPIMYFYNGEDKNLRDVLKFDACGNRIR